MGEFNLKSGNATPFKMMGSSPAKQAIGGDAGEQLTAWNKYKAAKAQDAAVNKLATNKNISKKAFDTKLAKITKTVNPHSTAKKIGNLSSKSSLVQDVKFGARQGYGLDKNLRMGRGFSTTTRVASRGGQIAKTIVKGASKVLTAVTVPLTLYDFYKSGQKHSDGKVNPNQKSFMAEAKKNTTSIFNKSKKPKGSSSHDFDDTLPK